MKFRKKPVVIEAIQWDGTEAAADELVAWIRAGDGEATHDRVARSASRYNREYEYRVMIRSLEGWMTASPGDWIIRGVHGEHYPCKPDIFEATYEPTEEPCSCGSREAYSLTPGEWIDHQPDVCRIMRGESA